MPLASRPHTVLEGADGNQYTLALWENETQYHFTVPKTLNKVCHESQYVTQHSFKVTKSDSGLTLSAKSFQSLVG